MPNRASVRQLPDGRFAFIDLDGHHYFNTPEGRDTTYRVSLDSPASFWTAVADQFVDWKSTAQETVVSADFTSGQIRWFPGRTLNVCWNCVDRHVESGQGDGVAFIWEPNNPSAEAKTYTYAALLEEVTKAANALKQLGIGKGDRVIIYLQMIPELPIAMLACARIGAIHSVVFGATQAEGLLQRINDCGAKLVICQDIGWRGDKRIDMKSPVNEALEGAPSVEAVIMVEQDGLSETTPANVAEYYWHGIVNDPSPCEPEWVDAEDPLFILYTSGSTGKPKGMVHTSGGYLTYVAYTFWCVFDYHPGAVHWCTADIGWITGHSYTVYGPLATGATVVLFEGTPSYPDHDRFWQVIERHKVNIFYTAPTALRALMREGNHHPNAHDLTSLRILGSVGEPIKFTEWMWYHQVIGQGCCPIMDTYWQTETGGFLIAPMPCATATKPGSATLPLPGIRPVVLNDAGAVIKETEATGNLAIAAPWPGMARTIWGDHKRFVDTYFAPFPGYYFTGDGCRRDQDGYYWITGRVDDVMILSGHNVGSAEVEGAIGQHPAVAEAAVVGVGDAVAGEAAYALIILRRGMEDQKPSLAELNAIVRAKLGAHVKLSYLQIVDGLPKTRSGKIMRRLLRKIVEGQTSNLGDVSTLADPSVIESLVAGRIPLRT